MARYEHLPIFREAYDLTVHIEKAVSGKSSANRQKHSMAERTARHLDQGNGLACRWPGALDQRPLSLLLCADRRF